MEKNQEKTTEISPEDRFLEIARIMHNLRFYTKYWHEHGGFHARKRMKYWEEKADAFLDKIGLTLHNNTRNIQTPKN